MDSERAHYSPPWANTSIIGIAGCSGSGKTSLAIRIVESLNLPWVVILSMDSFYRPLDAQQIQQAYRNEYDFDAPTAIDHDLLFERLQDLKAGSRSLAKRRRRAQIPRYSFQRHQRDVATTTIYSPHVLILEGIFALYDQRVLDMLDMRIFAEADADVCLGRRILRDVKERGRDIAGCIKQWTAFVKPNFERFVEPQRKVADLIVPRGIENRVAIDMIVGKIRSTLKQKSQHHQEDLQRLGRQAEDEPLSANVFILPRSHQLRGMHTLLHNHKTDNVDFVFYFDRIASLLVESALEHTAFETESVVTPSGANFKGLCAQGQVSAVIKLRGGACLETGLRRVIPDCRMGRMLIQSSYRTGEPELHYLRLPPDVATHQAVLLLDSQMSSGGAALMAVRAMVDHGISEHRIIFVTLFAGKIGLNRLLKVYPGVRVVLAEIGDDDVERWVEARYFGC